MARTVSWDILRDLAGFRAQKGCAISLYLDLDPSVTPTAGDAASRINALLAEGDRGFAKDTLTHDQKAALKKDFARIEEFFARDFDRDGSRGFALFVAGLDGAWSPLALTEPVADHVRIARRFHLAPLVPLVGRGDGALVAVVSRERGNLYRLRSGRLVELDDLSEEQPRRHDQGGWSQARYQRSIDNQAIQHVQTVAEELQRQLKHHKGARAVVVSTEEMRPEFESALDQESLAAVVGWTNAEAHANANELLASVVPVLERSRRRLEDEVVERWLEESGKAARAAAGWEQTLEAASDARVQVLLYANGVRRKAWQCPQCSRVAATPGSCPLDGTRMEEHDDAVDLAVCRVLEGGGTVWALEHRTDLDDVEGVGALLRF
jgi:peptide chain release factor subunit 1